jgi:hypothetical protein
MKIKSTNFLMAIAIVAVFVAMANLVVTVNRINDLRYLTGYVTDTGTANLTIEASAAINFTTDSINWGTGHVADTYQYAVLDTEGTVTNSVDWSTVSSGLALENIGNVNVSINLTSSKNATDFIGGGSGAIPDPTFKWKVSESEANSCQGATSITSYTEATTISQLACSNMGYLDSADVLEIDLELNIPSDAIGVKGAIITATATAI